MTLSPRVPAGAGLGLRREFADQFDNTDLSPVSFFELAPENWIGVGGRMTRQLDAARHRAPLVAHGLSLSIGSPAPLDRELLRHVRDFLRAYDVRCYTEHLSYCSDDGLLYELLPIPFTEEAVHYVAGRLRQAQDMLGERIGIENVSYYAAPGQQLAEIDFINAVVAEADCGLLLDVNNVYVNSINHGYDARQFLSRLPADRIMYVHIAGHFDQAEDLKIDSHGAAVIEPVWQLLAAAYRLFGPLPTLLERDFNFPPLAVLIDEVRRIKALQGAAAADDARAADD